MCMDLFSISVLLDDLAKVQNINPVTAMHMNGNDMLFVAEWSHPSPAQIHQYRTELMVNGKLMHNRSVSDSYTYFIGNQTGPYLLNVYAIDVCGRMSKSEMSGTIDGKTIVVSSVLNEDYRFYTVCIQCSTIL